MTIKRNLIGQVFSRLTVIGEAPNRGPRPHWLCRCECGNLKEIGASAITKGATRSCGCLFLEYAKTTRGVKHGMFGTPTYATWRRMKQRCYCPGNPSYPDYGGRGIKVCDKWHDFAGFYADMGARPEGMSLDRIDVNGDYATGNCRWLSMSGQQNNKRNSIRVRVAGIESTLTEAARRFALKPQDAINRHNKGHDLSEFFAAPVEIIAPGVGHSKWVAKRGRT